MPVFLEQFLQSINWPTIIGLLIIFVPLSMLLYRFIAGGVKNALHNEKMAHRDAKVRLRQLEHELHMLQRESSSATDEKSATLPAIGKMTLATEPEDEVIAEIAVRAPGEVNEPADDPVPDAGGDSQEVEEPSVYEHFEDFGEGGVFKPVDDPEMLVPLDDIELPSIDNQLFSSTDWEITASVAKQAAAEDAGGERATPACDDPEQTAAEDDSPAIRQEADVDTGDATGDVEPVAAVSNEENPDAEPAADDPRDAQVLTTRAAEPKDDVDDEEDDEEDEDYYDDEIDDPPERHESDGISLGKEEQTILAAVSGNRLGEVARSGIISNHRVQSALERLANLGFVEERDGDITETPEGQHWLDTREI